MVEERLGDRGRRRRALCRERQREERELLGRGRHRPAGVRSARVGERVRVHRAQGGQFALQRAARLRQLPARIRGPHAANTARAADTTRACRCGSRTSVARGHSTRRSSSASAAPIAVSTSRATSADPTSSVGVARWNRPSASTVIAVTASP